MHLVLDNYATHQAPPIQWWLLPRPRCALLLTPTSASWLNLAERWFGELTTKKLQRSAPRTAADLEADSRAWIAGGNDYPRPYGG